MLFILGTDEYSAKLQDALQAKISDNIVIVTPSSAGRIASANESDTIIIAGEKRDTVLQNTDVVTCQKLWSVTQIRDSMLRSEPAETPFASSSKTKRTPKSSLKRLTASGVHLVTRST